MKIRGKKSLSAALCLLFLLPFASSALMKSANAFDVDMEQMDLAEKAKVYSDYFSEEYRFEVQADHPETKNEYVFLYSQEHINLGITGFRKGYLYKTYFGNLCDPDTTVQIYPDEVTAYAQVNDHIYACSGNEIFQIDYDGNGKQTILQTNGPVTHMRANDTLIFYVVNDVMYRYFIPTQTLDNVGEVPGIAALYPISNYQVNWIKPNPDWCGNEECPGDPTYCDSELCVGAFKYLEYLININTGEQTPFNMSSAEEEALYESLPYPPSSSKHESRRPPASGETSLSAASSYGSINGKAIPAAAYPAGSYFTNNGSACSPHSNGEVGPNCKKYTTNDGFRIASQCMGFSYWVYDYIWNPSSFPEQTPSTISLATADDVRFFLEYVQYTCRRGSVLRVNNSTHSVVLIDYSWVGETISIYDANWDKVCGVRTYDYSFDGFAKFAKNISYLYY